MPQSASNDYFKLKGKIKPVAEGTTSGSDANDADGDLIPDPIDSTPFGNLTAAVNDTSRNPGDPVRINVSAAPAVQRDANITLINATNGNDTAVGSSDVTLDGQGNASAEFVMPQDTVGDEFVGEAVLQQTGNVSKENRTTRTDIITVFNGSLPDADDDDIPDSQDPTPFGGFTATANVTSLTIGEPVKITASADLSITRDANVTLIKNGTVVNKSETELSQGSVSDIFRPNETGEFTGRIVLNDTGTVSKANRTANTSTITVIRSDADGDGTPDSIDSTPFGNLTAAVNDTSRNPGDPVRINVSAAPAVQRDANITLINATNGNDTAVGSSDVTLDGQGNASAEFVMPQDTVGDEFVGEAVLQQTGNVSKENRTTRTDIITVFNGSLPDADNDDIPDGQDSTPFGGLSASANVTSLTVGEPVKISGLADPDVTRDVNITLIKSGTVFNKSETSFSPGSVSSTFRPNETGNFTGKVVVNDTEIGAVSDENRTANTSIINITVTPSDADGDGTPDSADSTPFGNLTAAVNDTSRNPGDPVRINVSAAPAVQRDATISLINATNGNDTAVGSSVVTLDGQGNASAVLSIPSQAAVGSEFVGRAVLEQTGAVSKANRTANTSIVTVFNGSLPDEDGDDIPDSQDPDSGVSGELVLFAQDGNLRSLTQDGTLTFSYAIENKVKALGPSRANFDADADLEVPVVVAAPNQNGKELLLVDDTGEVNQTRISGVKSGGVAVGSFDGSPESVFFVDQSTSDIYRFTPETATGKTQVKNVKAQTVVGIADVDGDGAEEIVFGGEGPNGDSDTVNYIDDDRSLKGTGIEYESDDGAGLGGPADFNNDGEPRIPVVNDNQNIALVNDTGESTVLTSGQFVKKAPIATTDWDSDGSPEIMFLATDGELKYIDNVTGDNNLRVPVDEDGDAFTNIDTAPGLSGGQRATARTQTSSRTNAAARTRAVFVQNGDLSARDASGTVDTPTVPGTIKATGGALDLTGGSAKEYPVVLSDNSGTLKLNGTGTALTTDIKTQPVAVRASVGGGGQFNLTAPSIFYARSSDGAIARITPGGSNVTYTGVSAQVVAGPADIDGDDDAELVFGGNGPNGNSQTLNYIDDDGSVEGIKTPYGSNNAGGVGQPGDFDGDGVARVPAVNGNNEVVLVDGAGRTETLVSDAKKSTPSTVDFDNDSQPEIVYISTDGTLRYIDDIGTGNPTSVEIGGGISGDPSVGVQNVQPYQWPG